MGARSFSFPLYLLSVSRASARSGLRARARLISQSKPKNSVVKCTGRTHRVYPCVGVVYTRLCRCWCAQPLPVFGRKSRIAECNRCAISRECVREMEETANEFISPAKRTEKRRKRSRIIEIAALRHRARMKADPSRLN